MRSQNTSRFVLRFENLNTAFTRGGYPPDTGVRVRHSARRGGTMRIYRRLGIQISFASLFSLVKHTCSYCKKENLYEPDCLRS